MLNHIYKIIWNRARACWQVVAETAKSNGKVKSSRRQKRLDNTLPLPARREYKKLAAALAVVLGCSLGGVAYAAEGETTADGLLSYNAGGAASKTVFADWQDGKVSQPGTVFNTVTLGNSPRLINPTTGAALVFNGPSFNTILNYYNNAASGTKSYDTIMAVIYVPDPANPGSTIAKTYTVYTASQGLLFSYGDLTTPALTTSNIATDYWKLPEIAQQLYRAQQDAQSSDPATKVAGEAKLADLIRNGLPHIYAVQGDDWQNGILLPLGTSAKPIGLMSWTTSLSSSPSDSTIRIPTPAKQWVRAASGVPWTAWKQPVLL
jgi:hypothetical protein